MEETNNGFPRHTTLNVRKLGEIQALDQEDSYFGTQYPVERSDINVALSVKKDRIKLAAIYNNRNQLQKILQSEEYIGSGRANGTCCNLFNAIVTLARGIDLELTLS